ncbi:MAG TPA: polysaccharide pyruvyl transferase CsaB [Candidatus Baltobacteraceae bacterium]
MRLLLSGYYGFGNLGDEALLEVIVSNVRARFPAVAIDVLSAEPQATTQRFGIDATPRWDARAVRAAIGRADVVASGGGGLLQNKTSLRSLLYYTGVIHQAIKAKRKTMIFAQSIGPLDLFGRFIVREGCNGLSRATVRDARSRELLSSVLPKVSVEQTADPVFLYDAPDEAVDLSAEGLGPQSRPYAIVSVRKVPGFNEGVATIARAIDRLHAEHGIRSALLPLGGAQDAEVSTLIIRKATSSPVLLPECSLARAAAIVRGAHVVVGMRLHALILAARYDVPFLAIPYDPKVQSLCEDLAYPLPPLWVPGKMPPQAQEAIDLVDRLIERRDAISAHLHERVAVVRAAAARNFDVLGELLIEP